VPVLRRGGSEGRSRRAYGFDAASGSITILRLNATIAGDRRRHRRHNRELSELLCRAAEGSTHTDQQRRAVGRAPLNLTGSRTRTSERGSDQRRGTPPALGAHARVCEIDISACR
jgi:hypothetical protein